MTTRNLLKNVGAPSGIYLVSTSSTQNSATGASLVLNKPAGVTTGDVMIAFIASSATVNSTWTGASGWTLIASSSGEPNSAYYYRVATATESASWTWTFSRSTSILGGSIAVFRNAVYLSASSITTNGNQSTQPRTASGATLAYSTSAGVAAFMCANPTPETYTVTSPSGTLPVVENTDATSPSWKVVYQKIDGTTTVPDVVANTSAATNSTTNAIQIFLIPADAVLLSGLSQTTPAATSFLTTSNSVSVTSGSGTVTPPSGVTTSKNGGAYTSSAQSFTVGDSFTFRATSSATANSTTNYTIPFSSTHGANYTWTVNTATAQLFTASGTLVVPQGVTSMSMLVIGAGGGGGTPSPTAYPAYGGGGGGALSYTNSVAVTSGETLTITVGNGGLGGPTAVSAGSTGGTSSISRGGTTLVSALGGGGSSGQGGAAGGQAGSGVGSVQFSGGPGGTAESFGASGGSGGGAATTASNGPAGLAGLGSINPSTGGSIITQGGAGQGTSLTTTGWTIIPAQDVTANGATTQADGYICGGGGGGGCTNTSMGSSTNIYGNIGGRGGAVIIWGGRTFSSATTF